MKARVSYGYKCPKCNSTFTVRISLGLVQDQKQYCPSCGTEMKPDANASPVAMNVLCRKCNAQYGMVFSDTCPNCGTPF